MTLIMFSGCVLLVFGPAASLYWFFVKPQAQLTVLLLARFVGHGGTSLASRARSRSLTRSPRALSLTCTNRVCTADRRSAFYWLLFTSVAAVWWAIIPPMRERFGWVVVCSALANEAGRYGLYSMLARVFAKLAGEGASPPSKVQRLRYSFACGLGYAMLHAATGYLGSLMTARGPGSLFTPGCNATSLFLVNGLSALAFLLLDVFFMVIAFYGYERGRYVWPAGVLGAHVLAGLWTLLFQAHGLCGLAMFALYATVLAVGGAFAYVLLQTVKEDRGTQ